MIAGIQTAMSKVSRGRKRTPDSVSEGAVPAEVLTAEFPKLNLPITPPYAPEEARSVDTIPSGNQWQYEPKWDGFRCLAFREGDTIVLQSKSGQPLGRYFPELVQALLQLSASKFVLDGEIVIELNGRLSFDDLLMRIHPAESRIRKLSQQTPATLLTFDLLVDSSGNALADLPLKTRRQKLETFMESNAGDRMKLSPVTTSHEQAVHWMTELAGAGFDGVIAKLVNAAYASGERTAMQKIKRMKTADCVVGGFRWSAKGGEV